MTLIDLIAIVVVGMPAINWYICYRLVRAAWPRPRDSYLTSNALVSLGIAIGSTIGGFLGVHTIVFNEFGVRIVPVGVSVYLIAAALIVISIPNLQFFRVLRRLDREARVRVHRRLGDKATTIHRRTDDAP